MTWLLLPNTCPKPTSINHFRWRMIPPKTSLKKQVYLNYLALAFEGLNWNHQTTIDYTLEAQQFCGDVFIDYVMALSFFRMSEIEQTYGERALEIIENMMNQNDILFFPYLDVVVGIRNELSRNPSDDIEVFRILDDVF